MAQEFYITNNTLLQSKIKNMNNQKNCNRTTTKNLIQNPRTATNDSKKKGNCEHFFFTILIFTNVILWLLN
jgi:hypothetical protein